MQVWSFSAFSTCKNQCLFKTWYHGVNLYSVSGHYVPQLSQLIYERNKGIQNPVINFKGFMVMNYSLRHCGWCLVVLNWEMFILNKLLLNGFIYLPDLILFFRWGTLLLMTTMIMLAHSSIGGLMVWYLILPIDCCEKLVILDPLSTHQQNARKLLQLQSLNKEILIHIAFTLVHAIVPHLWGIT